MNRSLVRLMALVLPLIGLGGTWLWAHIRAQQGTEWDVPVSGYDPRDLLRGHYIVYRYDWPRLEAQGDMAFVRELCLIGNAPVIVRVTVTDWRAGPCRNPVRASGTDMRRGGSLAGGILYVPQQEAARLERKLADPQQQGIVRIRVRGDGYITPLRITFRPRPASAVPSPTAAP